MVQQEFRVPVPMVAITSTLQPALSNRRRRVRHKIQTPAYVTFTAESQGVMLDLHEIVNLSEDGVAIQCHAPLEVNQNLSLCLDLAGCEEQIFTTGRVVWTNDSGRAGLRFSPISSDSLGRLREWLFVNVMSRVANGEDGLSEAQLVEHFQVPPTPNHTDRLAAVAAVQRQVQALGPDFASALQLITERAIALLGASGSAIALVDTDADFMICRASSGPDAPPVGARLHVGAGFSGECVQKGVLLRCDDTEIDSRVDPESCRALGIRSILATPVRAGQKSIGLIEVFSTQPHAFSQSEERVLQKLADIVFDAATRALRAENLPSPEESKSESFSSPQGSVLFASAEQEQKISAVSEESVRPSITLPRWYLFALTLAVAAISLVLGLSTAPWIQSSAAPWILRKIHSRQHAQLPTVLASSNAPSVAPTIETATFSQLQQMAESGDPAAQNALGLRYFQGDPAAGIKQNELEAARWFTTAAEHGNVAAQSKLGFLFWSGRGVPKDLNRAYLWTMVACENSSSPKDPSVVLSQDLARVLRQQMTREQSRTIEGQAKKWLRQHETPTRPEIAQSKQS